MNHLRNGLACAAIGMMLSSVAAAGVTTARISQILIYDRGDLVYIYPVGGVSNPPACHGANGNYLSFSMARPRAKEYLAGLLAAQAEGATVNFYGTGTCTDQWVSETLDYYTIISS